MCGIAGYIDFGGLNRAEARPCLERMTDAIRHRGPDAEGYYVDAHAALGHRRLAIIDVSTGQQPMAAADGQVQIVFNGEIYNYRELRQELELLGHVFRTQSDTEVLLLGYLQWGEELAKRLNGMFAFVIWDARTKRALAVRDRAGEKPLYWSRQGTRFSFASELHALRAGGFIADAAIPPESLDLYLALGYVPAPRTIYRDVFKLRPAQQMSIDARGQRLFEYWALPNAPPRNLSMDEALEEFEPLFDDAVKRQMVSEVPLGAFLSGGLDSALIVSSMARQANGRVITNTIGSGDSRFDERALAREVAQLFGTEHHEYEIQPQAAAVLDEIIDHLDEPLADSSVVPTWYVCQMTRRNVTVALSGDGGDESFGGYTSRYSPHVAEARLRARIPVAVRAPLFGALHAVWPRTRRLPRPLRLGTIFGNLALSDTGAYSEDLAWLKRDARTALYSSEFIEQLAGFSPREVVEPYYAGIGDALSRSQRADQALFMTDDVLMKVDRMSMAHSLETRAPLLDHRIRNFAAGLPHGLKLQGGVGKLLLRRLAAKRLPESLRQAPKRGFSIDAAGWLRRELFDRLEVTLTKSPLLAQCLRPQAVTAMIDEHRSGARDHAAVLWGLLVLGAWEGCRSPLKSPSL